MKPTHISPTLVRDAVLEFFKSEHSVLILGGVHGFTGKHASAITLALLRITGVDGAMCGQIDCPTLIKYGKNAKDRRRFLSNGSKTRLLTIYDAAMRPIPEGCVDMFLEEIEGRRSLGNQTVIVSERPIGEVFAWLGTEASQRLNQGGLICVSLTS